jgi:hypothetical protein
LAAIPPPFLGHEQHVSGYPQGLCPPYYKFFIFAEDGIKLYSAILLGTCIAAFLCFTLPGAFLSLRHCYLELSYSEDFLPGKRAFAICLCLYHTIASTVLIQSPRFIPISFGATFESSVVSRPQSDSSSAHSLHSFKVTPEIVWGSLHGFLGVSFVTWWQVSVQ